MYTGGHHQYTVWLFSFNELANYYLHILRLTFRLKALLKKQCHLFYYNKGHIVATNNKFHYSVNRTYTTLIAEEYVNREITSALQTVRIKLICLNCKIYYF